MAHVLKRRDQEAVRWYVLTLPTKNLLHHLDKQRFIFLNMALLKITIS